ncbi:hypothetical protein ACFVYE_39145 [Streptomyces sp. NPDC058239]|uniref:hypothetical protein n=1 Tax=unclassified Streptomyces TaxID=2593676 RepID=UPI00365E0141
MPGRTADPALRCQVGIAAETGSARIVSRLDRLDRALAPVAREPGVAEFREAL